MAGLGDAQRLMSETLDAFMSTRSGEGLAAKTLAGDR